MNLYVCSDKVGLLLGSPSSVRLLADPLKLDVSVNYGAGRLPSPGYEGLMNKNKVLLNVIASDLKILK